MRNTIVATGLALASLPLMATGSGSTASKAEERMLKLPAVELSRECSAAANSRQFLELAKMGGEVVIAGRKVTKHNADKVIAEIDAQLAACDAVIQQRGAVPVAGSWRGQVTGCDRSGSLFAAAVAEAGVAVAITQQGAVVRIAISGKHEGQDYSFEARGRMVENIMVLIDPGNSDYPLVGEATNTRITIRPDTDRVLAAWPGWAGPPKRADLESCRVTLEPLTSSESPPAP